MQLSEAAAKLRKMVGNPSVTDSPDTNLYEHINAAHKELLDKYAFHKARQRKRFSTQIGVDKYLIEPTTSTVLKVWDRTNKLRLQRADRRYVAEHEFDGTAVETRGKPIKYARFVDYMQLLPIPDGVYVIEFMYHLNPVPLTNAGDSMLTPPAWDRGMLLMARYYYYSDESRDTVKATASFNEFKAWLEDKPVEMHEEQMADMDSGIEIPTLSDPADRGSQGFDFDE